MTDLPGVLRCAAVFGGRWVIHAITFAFISGAILGCSGARSDPAGTTTEPSEAPIRIGTSGDYPPFSSWTGSPGSGEPQGFSADLVRAFAASRQREVEWVRFRWPALLEAGTNL